jgi:ACR3 family arsenite transporter
MAVGVALGFFLPSVPEFLNQFEIVSVNIPIGILIWLMIYPMMLKIDFTSVKNVGKNPKGLFVTWYNRWDLSPMQPLSL